MAVAFRILGAMTAAMAGFIGTIAAGMAITNGSAWMLAFVPLCIAIPGALLIIILMPIFEND